jgi:hypothetical protein
VRPINPLRIPIPCPQSSPALALVAATPGCHTLAYSDSLAVNGGRAKPWGAAFLEVRVAVADEVIRDVNEARPAGLFTRSPFSVSFTHAEDRKKATYFGRWVSRRGEHGGWSNPVSLSIAA